MTVAVFSIAATVSLAGCAFTDRAARLAGSFVDLSAAIVDVATLDLIDLHPRSDGKTKDGAVLTRAWSALAAGGCPHSEVEEWARAGITLMRAEPHADEGWIAWLEECASLP